jgi:hypothetical protein
MVKRTWAIVLSLVVVAVGADAAVQSRCLVGKNKCVVKRIRSLLKCEQKAETPGKPADPNADGCVDRAQAKFDGGDEPEKGCFERLEGKPSNDCVTLDDTASVAALGDQCVSDLVGAIDPPPIDQTRCGVRKKKCVAKKLAGLFKCYARAQTPGRPMEPNTNGCLDKVRAKYDGGTRSEKGCMVRLESKSNNDCLPPLENQADLAVVVATCVDSIVSALEAPPTTTTTTTPGGTTTTTTAGATTTTTSTSVPSSTTSTTFGTSANCSANGVLVFVSIDYPESTLGGISAILLSLNYPPPLSIPGTGQVASVRQRVTSLVGPGSAASPNDRDTNGDTVDDRLDVTVRAATSGSVNPGPAFQARFDCPSGTLISASSMTCSHSQATALDGTPHPPELASQITCSINVSPAP